MRCFTAPAALPQHRFGDEPNIFLAGSIEQGKAAEWQRRMIALFGLLPVTLFNPRRESWDPDMVQDIGNPVFKEQVTWELDALERSDIVFFYFQGGTLSPVTLMELGIVCTWLEMSDDPPYVVVVCEPEFWRLGNVQVLCERAGVRVLPTFDRGVDHLAEVCARHACGH